MRKYLVLGIILIMLLPQLAIAQDNATGFEKICSRDTGLANCVQQLYLFALGFGALLSLLMLVLAGYKYMTAQGNASQVESAKESFADAFIGLIIIFVAFILLNVINPDLVRFREPAKTLTLPEIIGKPPGDEELFGGPPLPTKARTDSRAAADAAIAQQIKNNQKISLSSSADYPGYNALGNINEIIAKNYPSVCSARNGCNFQGSGYGSVVINSDLLQGILRLAGNPPGYSFTITSISTGKHSGGSSHYTGRAVDIVSSSSDRSTWVQIRQYINGTLGGKAICEDTITANDVPDCSAAQVNHIHWSIGAGASGSF